MARSPVPFRRKYLVEALEPRVLLSADLPVVPPPPPDPVPPAQAVDAAHAAAGGDLPAPVFDATHHAEASVADGVQLSIDTHVAPPDAPSQAGAPSEVAFVDSRVLQTDPTSIQRDGMLVVVLDADQDGFAQISKVLSGLHDLKAIHLIGHGDPGEMFLGKSVLNADAVEHGKVADWGAALSKDGDLLLYGCDVAKGQTGEQFIRELAAATGADVGASTDATGNAAAGGNWNLEFVIGHLETAPIAQLDLSGVLTTFTGTSGTDNFAGDNAAADIFNFDSAKLTSADTVDGNSGGADELRITDAASLSDTAFTGVREVEKLVLGDFDNSLVLGAKAALWAGTADTGTLTVDASAQTAGQDLTLEIDALANYVINAGAGTNDVLDLSGVSVVDLTFQISAGLVTITGNGKTITATGFEKIIGGSGTNIFRFQAGGSFSGSIEGNGTVNTLDYSSFGTGVAVDLAAGTADGVTGTVSEITKVVGSAFGDTITDGGDGDTYQGGAGNDTYIFADDLGDDTVTDSGGDDTYLFGDDWGNDVITDSGGDNVVDFTAESRDLEVAFNGATTLVSEGPTNTLSFTVSGTATVAEFHGSAGDDTFKADLDVNVATDVYGGEGDDKFQVQVGSDFSGVVDGEGGEDTLDYTLRGGNVKFDAVTDAPDNFSGSIDNVEKIQHPLTIPDGVRTVAGLIQDGIDATVGAIDIPMLGNVGGEADSFISDIATKVADGLTTALLVDYGDTRSTGDIIEDWLVDTLQVDFTNMIPGATVGTFGLVAIDSQHMEFALVMQGVIFDDTWDIDFGGAIPGLGLDVDAQVEVSLTYDLRLAFGIDYSDVRHPDFYFDTNGANDTDPADDAEITLTLAAELENGDINDPQLIATLGFLQFEVTSYDNSGQVMQDDPGTASPYQDSNRSGIHGSFSIDLRDPGSEAANTWAEDDGRLTKTEFSNPAFKLKENIVAIFDARADVDLFLRLSADVVSAGLPSIQFYLHFDQVFGHAEIAFDGTNQGSFGGAPTVVIEDLSLDLGTFLSNFIQPILEQVQVFTQPLQPIVDLLKSDIPILSDIDFLKNLLNKDGENGVDMLDFAGTLLGGTKYASVVKAVDAIVELIDLVNSIPTEGTILINFGTFTFGGGGNDLRGSGSQMEMPTNTPDEDAVRNKIKNNSHVSSDTKSFLDKLKRDPINGGFSIPILTEPSQILKLITGRTADLFRYDLPQLDFDFDFRKSVSLVFPLNMVLDAGFDVTVRLGFGYDSSGIQKAIANGFSNPEDIFDGFFIDDHGVEGTPGDLDEVEVHSHFGVGASVGVAGIVEAGVEGGVTGNIGFDFNDVDAGLGYDGKIHFDELMTLFQAGPLGFLDMHGSLDWFLQAFVWVGLDLGIFGKITLYDDTFDLGGGNIVSFENHYTVQIPPDVAHIDGSGNLVLHMGADANRRDDDPASHGYADLDGNAAETFTVDLSDDGTQYVVGYNGTTERFAVSAVTGNIVVNDAQGGNDVLTVGEGVRNPAGDLIHPLMAGLVFNGGDGNDKVTYLGHGTATIHGGAGDDRITATNGAAILYGDAGNDTLTTGAFDDQIFGGDGNDKIKSGAGNDWIEGGMESVLLTSGKANGDTIDAGDGNDVVYGGASSTGIVNFGSPSAAASGESGSDTIKGGKGDDRIYGGDESEGTSAVTATGKKLGDSIDGGAGNDTVFAGGGADTIKGGTGDDVLWGGSGDDAFTGGTGIDQIRGEAGNDSINWAVGDAVDSVIDGGADNDAIIVTGANVGTDITLSRIGSTADVSLAWGSDNLSLVGLEKFALNAGTGLDHFYIRDLAGTTAKEVAMSLGASLQDVTRYDWDGDGVIETAEGAGPRYLLDATGAQILDGAGNPVFDDFGVLSDVVRITSFDTAADTVEIDSGTGNDQFTGATLTDSVSGGTVLNVSRTGTASIAYSVAQSGAALDTFLLSSDGGDDSIDFSAVTAQILQAVTLSSGDGNDTVFGTQFADSIDSGAGDDRVSGNAGIDSFTDGGGSDILTEVNNGSPTTSGTARTFFDLTNAQFSLDGNGLTITRGATVETEDTTPFETVALIAGSGANTFTVQNWAKVARLDGGAGSDTYNLHFLGSGPGSVTEDDSIQNPGDVDQMFVYGTSGADNFSFTADNEHNPLTDGTISLTHGTVESVHYTHSENVEVRGGDGDDVFVVDDNGVPLHVYGEAGADHFLVGRITASHVDPDSGAQVADAITNGISAESFFYGDFGEDGAGNEINVAQSGNDDFEVNHNKAPIWLFGNAGDDRFVVNAVLVQDPTSGLPVNDSNVSGGSGVNSITYLQNAPVNIDGGSGNDTVVVNGTGLGDTFIIAVVDDGSGPQQKVIGAGLQINMKNVERLEVNGAGGDDNIYVFSTLPGLDVEVSGGSGNDTIHIGGENVSIVVDPPAYTIDPPAYTYDPPPFIDHWDSVTWSWGDFWYFDWSFPFWHYQPPISYTWWYPVWVDPVPVTIDPPPQTFDPAPFQFSAGPVNVATGIEGKLTIDGGSLDANGNTGNDDDRIVVHNTGGDPADTLTLTSGDHDDDAGTADIGYATGLGMTRPDGSGGTMTGGFYYSNAEELQFYLSDSASAGDDVTVDYTDPLATTTVFGGQGDDHFRVKAASGTLQLDGGAGNDGFDIWNDQNLLSGIAGTVRINGGTGTDSVDIRDTADTSDAAGTLTSSALTGLGMGGSIQYGSFIDQTFTYSYQQQTVNAAPPPTILTTHTTQTFTYHYDPIEALTVSLGSGNDVVDVHGTLVSTTINANDGNDTINVSSDGALLQGSLDDVNGALFLHLGAGENTLNVSDRGDADADAVVTIGSSSIVGLAPAAISYDALGGRFAGGVNIWAGRGNDGITIASTLAGDVLTLDSNDGDDSVTVSAGQAADVIVLTGGQGKDTLDASATTGTTLVLIGDEGEALYGSTTKSFSTLVTVQSLNVGLGDDDTLSGGSGVLLAIGGAGTDTASGNGANDVLVGDDGEITLLNTIVTRARSLGTAGGGDFLHGGAGQNILIGGLGGDTLDALGGDDVAIGDNGDVTFDAAGVVQLAQSTDEGQGGDDVINVADGRNVVLGGAGADHITAGSGDDVLLGDNGRFEFTITAGVAVLTRAETTDVQPGTAGDDVIVTGEGRNVVLAGLGNDHINDPATSPASAAGSGDDVVLGDNGFVTWTAAGVVTAAESTQLGQGGADVLTVGEGNNIVVGGSGADAVTSGAGDDIVLGDNGRLTFSGGVLVEALTTDTADATGGADLIAAGDGRNVVLGGAGGDAITTGAGDDVIGGDNGIAQFDAAGKLTLAEARDPLVGGDDAIDSGAGNDVIIGGIGADTLLGGAGNDVLLGDGGTATFIAGELVEIIGDSATGGDDFIDGGPGSDIMLGGAGVDTMNANFNEDLFTGGNARIFFSHGLVTSIELIGGIDFVLQTLFDSFSVGQALVFDEGSAQGSGEGEGVQGTAPGGFGSEGIYASDGTAVLPGSDAVSFRFAHGVPLARLPETLRNIVLELYLGAGEPPASSHGGGAFGASGSEGGGSGGEGGLPRTPAAAAFEVEASASTIVDPQDEHTTLALAAGAFVAGLPAGMARKGRILEREAFERSADARIAARGIDW